MCLLLLIKNRKYKVCKTTAALTFYIYNKNTHSLHFRTLFSPVSDKELHRDSLIDLRGCFNWFMGETWHVMILEKLLLCQSWQTLSHVRYTEPISVNLESCFWIPDEGRPNICTVSMVCFEFYHIEDGCNHHQVIHWFDDCFKFKMYSSPSWYWNHKY